MYDYQKTMFEAYSKSDNTHAMFIGGRRAGKSTIMNDWAKTLQQFVQGFRLELSEGTVFGQKYYCVEPQGWIWRDFDWKDMVEWCESTMERESKTITPDLRWYVNSGQFWFRDEKDQVMFILRWS
jgi:hypothetical protein